MTPLDERLAATREALRLLLTELSEGMLAEWREVAGNTNAACLIRRIEQARAALSTDEREQESKLGVAEVAGDSRRGLCAQPGATPGVGETAPPSSSTGAILSPDTVSELRANAPDQWMFREAKELCDSHEALREELAEETASREVYADLLRRICDALKGPPPELALYSWHDLPGVAAEMRAELAHWKDRALHAEAYLQDTTTSGGAVIAELERVRVQLAGCGVAAMQNTEKTIADRAKPGDYGWSASYGDVCRAVDREMELRKRVEDLQEQVAGTQKERYRFMTERDAALARIKDLEHFVRDVARNYDCDSDGHRYSTGCRSCGAQALLTPANKSGGE